MLLKTGILIFDVFIIILSVSFIRTAGGWYSLPLLGLGFSFTEDAPIDPPDLTKGEGNRQFFI